MLERVPRPRVGPLHLLEHEHERPIRGEQTHVLGKLAEQTELASRTRDGRHLAERRLQVLQLGPFSFGRRLKDVRRAKQRAPRAVWFWQRALRRRDRCEQSAAQPNLGLELPEQGCRARSGGAGDAHDARLSRARLVEPLPERRELLHAARESIDGKRTPQCVMMRGRHRRRAVASLRLNSGERGRAPLRAPPRTIAHDPAPRRHRSTAFSPPRRIHGSEPPHRCGLQQRVRRPRPRRSRSSRPDRRDGRRDPRHGSTRRSSPPALCSARRRDRTTRPRRPPPRRATAWGRTSRHGRPITSRR